MSESSNVVTKGSLVRVEYVKQSGNGQWGLWTMTAIFLGRGRDRQTIDFSLRPVMGSTSMDLRHQKILKVEVLKSSDEIMMLGGVRDRRLEKLIVLPKRLGKAEKPQEFA